MEISVIEYSLKSSSLNMCEITEFVRDRNNRNAYVRQQRRRSATDQRLASSKLIYTVEFCRSSSAQSPELKYHTSGRRKQWSNSNWVMEFASISSWQQFYWMLRLQMIMIEK